MRTGTTRKMVTALSVVWILWSFYLTGLASRQLARGGLPTEGVLWTAKQGFESRKACMSAARKADSDSDSEKGRETFHCFPSSFDPR